jgi:hypothetical protein
MYGNSGNDAVAGDMTFVAELDGLFARDVGLCHQGDRLTAATSSSKPPMKKTAPKMLTRAIVLVLR